VSGALEERSAEDRRQPLRRWVRKLAWLAIPVTLAGELSHRLLERLGQTLAHHLFHILFAGAAAVAFVVFVAIDVRRHGWPIFSRGAGPTPVDPRGGRLRTPPAG
jgi:hypothetical protein